LLLLDPTEMAQSLPLTGGVDDEPERLPDWIGARGIIHDLSEIKASESEQLPNDPIRSCRRIRQDLVKDDFWIGDRLFDEPLEMREGHASAHPRRRALRPVALLFSAHACLRGRIRRCEAPRRAGAVPAVRALALAALGRLAHLGVKHHAVDQSLLHLGPARVQRGALRRQLVQLAD
jgi:hypothetical protein